MSKLIDSSQVAYLCVFYIQEKEEKVLILGLRNNFGNIKYPNFRLYQDIMIIRRAACNRILVLKFMKKTFMKENILYAGGDE